MGASHDEIDLDLRIEDPEFARSYIETFEWGHPPPKYVVLALDQQIWFERMSDLEAVCAAKYILHAIHIPQEVNRRDSGVWEIH